MNFMIIILLFSVLIRAKDNAMVLHIICTSEIYFFCKQFEMATAYLPIYCSTFQMNPVTDVSCFRQ